MADGGLTGAQGSDTVREKTPVSIVDGGNDPEPMIGGRGLIILSFCSICENGRQNPAALGRLLKTEGMEPDSTVWDSKLQAS